jgi:hypothetical protein
MTHLAFMNLKCCGIAKHVGFKIFFFFLEEVKSHGYVWGANWWVHAKLHSVPKKKKKPKQNVIQSSLRSVHHVVS